MIVRLDRVTLVKQDVAKKKDILCRGYLPREARVKRRRLPVWILLLLVLSIGGCFNTLEQRWEAFDAERREEIGVKTKEYFIKEWGKPAKRAKSADGGEILTWEFSGYGGAQGWRKTLLFTQDGVLKDFSRDYWPKESY